MTSVLTRHPLVAYYVLTFAISWGGFVLAVGPTSLVSANWQAEGKFLPAVLTMLSGPSIAGLLLTGFIDGRSGYRHLWRRVRTWRVGLAWYTVALVPAPVVCAGALVALSIPLPLVVADSPTGVFFGGIGAAATTILEEVGWTGFAVPRLLRRHGVPMTGLIVGVL